MLLLYRRHIRKLVREFLRMQTIKMKKEALIWLQIKHATDRQQRYDLIFEQNATVHCCGEIIYKKLTCGNNVFSEALMKRKICFKIDFVFFSAKSNSN